MGRGKGVRKLTREFVALAFAVDQARSAHVHHARLRIPPAQDLERLLKERELGHFARLAVFVLLEAPEPGLRIAVRFEAKP